MVVKVAFPIPTEQVFDYAVPAALAAAVAVGKRVRAPFGGKPQTGYIIAVSATADVENPKEIIEIIDARPMFGARELAFYRWIADYYLYPLGKALHEILPGGKDIRSKKEKTALRIQTAIVPVLTPRQRLVLEAIPAAGRGDGVSIATLRRSLGDVRPILASW